MFPRELFTSYSLPMTASHDEGTSQRDVKDLEFACSKEHTAAVVTMTPVLDQTPLMQRFPHRSYLQMLKPWSWVPEDKMSFFAYFR